MSRRAPEFLQVILVLLGIAGGLWLLYKTAVLIVVLILAALAAYAIAPIVHFAQRPVRIGGRRRHLPRGPAIALVYVLTAGAAAAGAALLFPIASAQFHDMVARTPEYTQSFLTWQHGWSRYYDRLHMPSALRRNINQSVVAASAAAVASAKANLVALAGALTDLPWMILIPIFAFFFLKDGAHFRRSIVTALPHGIQLRAHRLFDELSATLAAFVRAQLLACVLVGVMCGVGFAALGTPYPMLLGALAGVLELIPLVGPLLLAAIASIAGGLHAPILAVWTIVFLGILRLVEDYVIYPRLMRRSIHLHPLAVILSVLVGAEVGGVAGMFLAIPALAMATVAYSHWMGWRIEPAG